MCAIIDANVSPEVFGDDRTPRGRGSSTSGSPADERVDWSSVASCFASCVNTASSRCGLTKRFQPGARDASAMQSSIRRQR